MATKEQIMKAILDVAGHPDTGVVAEYAERWADAIVGLDADVPFEPNARDGDGDGNVQDGTKWERPAKETRVTKPGETR